MKFEKGQMLLCVSTFKVPGLSGGFTESRKYEILGMNEMGELLLMDDENLRHDPMEVNVHDLKKYFNIECDIIEYPSSKKS